MTLTTLLIIVVVLAVCGLLPIGGRGPYLGTGYYGGGGIWIVALILLFLVLRGSGRI